MQAAVSDNVDAIELAAEAFGPRLEQALTLLKSTFTQAAQLESTPPQSRTSAMAAKLDSQVGLVDDIQEALSETDVLYHHITAIGEATAALSWVVAKEPVDHLQQIAEGVHPPLAALRAKADPSHTGLADSVDAFISTLSAYVTRNPSALHFTPTSDADSPAAAQPEETAAHLQDFRRTVTDAAVKTFGNASEVIAPVVAQQANVLCKAVAHLYDFVVTASRMDKAPDDDARQNMLQPIITCMTDISSRAEACAPGNEYFNHLKAIDDAVAMLSWIVAESKPTSFVTEAEGTAGFYLNKILVTTKGTDHAAQHKAFVESMKDMFTAMRTYIKTYFPTGLQYGRGVHDTKASTTRNDQAAAAAADADEPAGGDNYVSAFTTLLSTRLAPFTQVCQELGGPVADQALVFAEAWKEEEAFLKKAISTPEPKDVQPMLNPIAKKIEQVTNFAETIGPRDEFTQHVTAVSESILALGWIAVDEKATAYVGDMAGAGQFFIDKVKMRTKQSANAQVHKAWAEALQALWAGLKAYVKEFHTQKLQWNPPKRMQRAGPSAGAHIEETSGSDYVSVFNGIVDGVVASFVAVSSRIGGEVSEQAQLFAKAWKAEASFLAHASVTNRPADIQPLLQPIGELMGKVSEIVESAGPRHALAHHLNAVAESIAALGWVAVEEKATVFVVDSAGAGQFYIDKVKMGAKKTEQAGLHREWCASLESCWQELKAYVKQHHTQCLVWNPPKLSPRTVTNETDADVMGGGSGGDYVSVFEDLVKGPVADYVNVCEKLGGKVMQQGKEFAEGWKAEHEFLKKAIAMLEPDDVQSMLGEIATRMQAVNAICEEAGPRDAFSGHLNAVSESMGALGWVAVDEKATVFVGDMSGAGQFYIDKVKMGARKTDQSELHKEWAACLETVWKDLKQYVKQYHTQKLTWNAGSK